jgi:hypothetical protein
MSSADGVQAGYKGCFGDGDGPYNSETWGGNRTLPATLNSYDLTYEQCAQAAARAGYEVFSLQGQGFCFMGTLADVDRMRQMQDDAICSTTPCVDGIGCVSWVSKVYSIGLSQTFIPFC